MLLTAWLPVNVTVVPFVMVAVSLAPGNPGPPPQLVHVLALLQLPPVPVDEQFAEAVYGPTIGPPPGAPIGVTAVFDVSPRARFRFKRPFPVSLTESAASVDSARRPTITAFEAEGSFACNSAASPATSAAEAEVPEIVVTPPPALSATIPTPGAAMKVSAPELENEASASLWFVADTPMTFASPAGYVGLVEPSLPVAATTTTPLDHA